MKVRVTIDIEIPDGYDIEDVEDYIEFQFGYNGMMTCNPLDQDNISLDIEDMTVDEI